jgi:hypothetical protein
VGNGTFLEHVDFPVGSEPTAVATGDFNGDGNLDLVVANFHVNTVSVLLGKGDGTFNAAVNYNVGHGPISVAVADLNGDHKLDLVVVNETDNNASVLLGNGDGTFNAQVAYPTGVGGNPLSVVIGDFNGDGIPDLAVADFQTQQVSVLLGNGDGSFQTVKAYSTGANPSSIVAADFNGDGKLDLALTSTPLGSSPGNLVSLLLGNGDGTFGAPALFGAGYLSYSSAVGDFNRDGAPDLAVANGGSNTVSLLLNVQGTAMNIQSSGNPSAFGQSVAFTTTVSASVSNGSAPTGTVTVKNGSTTIGSGALVGGKFSVSTTTLPVGADSLSAIYSGDSNYQTHTVGLTQTVQAAGTNTTLVSSANPSTPNQSITFSATVTSNTTGQPTGTVTFKDGTTTLGSSSVNGSGVATFSTSTLILGTHGITAVYSGSATFNGSTSSVLSQVVQKANTTTTLSSNPTSANLNQSVTFTATVAPGTAGVPTGMVTFLDGTTSLGSSALNGSGVANFSTGALTAGTHSITAAYGGDNNFNASSSTVASVAVAAPGFSISAAALSPSAVAPGASATSTITINPQGGLNPTTVALTCSVSAGASPAPTCSLGTISATNNIGSSVLTVATSGAQAALIPAGERGSGKLFAIALLIPAMLLGGAGLKTSSQRKLMSLCFTCLLLGACLLESACGSSGSKNPMTVTSSGTPAGTYTVTITGTSNGVQHTAPPLSLTVQ